MEIAAGNRGRPGDVGQRAGPNWGNSPLVSSNQRWGSEADARRM